MGSRTGTIKARAVGKATEKAVLSVYRMMGATVWKTSQPRQPRGMTAGLPDLLVFLPVSETVEFFFHEVKGGRGVLSPAQREFKAFAEAAGLTVIVGGTHEAAAHMNTLRRRSCPSAMHIES